MTEMPDDVMKAAEQHVPDMYRNGGFDHRSVSKAIAKAILAERERCARIAEGYSHGIYAAIAIRDE